MGDGAALDDSNCAGIGSDADKALRKDAASSEEAWKGCGEKPGVQIWRIEKFQVVVWPEEQYGNFYTGDSYIILLTSKTKGSDALHWDIFFLLGSETSQDEMGTAAYKTVELDDLLDGNAHQHREVQDHESREFHAIFPAIHYLQGGIESGFHHVEADKYEPKMLHVRREKHTTRVTQVLLHKDSMNDGDCFIVDGGEKIYTFMGDTSDPFERSRCAAAAANIENERKGRARTISHAEDEEGFWKHLGGKGAIKTDVEAQGGGRSRAVTGGQGTLRSRAVTSIDVELVLYKMGVDKSKKHTFSEVGRSGFRELLETSGVFILDAETQVFAWVGKEAPRDLGTQAMHGAMEFVKENDKPHSTGIKLFREGKVINNNSWLKIMNS